MADPGNVPGLHARYRASSITGLTDGDPVASWPDSTGASNASQATAAAQPTYRAAGVGGQPSVQFDGTDDFLTSGANASLGDFTMVLVGTVASVDADGTAMGSSSSFGRQMYFRAFDDKMTLSRTASGSIGSASTSPALGVPFVSTMSWNWAGDNAWLIAHNGAVEGTGSNSNSISGGRTLVIGSNTGTGVFWLGHMAEVLIYDHTLTAAERAEVHTYVQDTYGITVSDYAGASTPTGAASGTWTYTGTAAGVTPASIPAGAATGAWSLTGSAVGTAPTGVPTGLTATAVSPARIDLAWGAVTGAVAYDVERDGVVIAMSHPSTSYADVGRQSRASHTYRVRAVSEDSGLLRDPALRRVAWTCDGNEHDTDDWGASPVALAVLSKEYLGNVVHWEYNNHIWASNGQTIRGGNWLWHSEQSNLIAAQKLGFDTAKFFSCVADGHGTYAAAAKANLVAQINASTSSDRLVVCCAGPMETIWQALNAADPTARTFVDLVSHSTWNEVHASETTATASHPDAPHGGHSWVDLDAFGCQTIDLSDQNGSGKLGDQSSSNFSYFNTGSDPWAHVWTQITTVDGTTATTDVSDAGMALYVVNGMVEPSTSPNYPTWIRNYLGL